MGYDDVPWIFTGRALYQLQFVKSRVARQYVPPDLKLVEFLGYTLGGFYLARYKDSPVGAFDEEMCRVARDHGLKQIGLPSRLAQFVTSPLPKQISSQMWWKPSSETPFASVSVRNVERRGWWSKNRGLKPSVCTFVMDHNSFEESAKGPRIKLSLPSFRQLLKYACRLNTNIRPVRPLKLHFEEEEDPENDELMTAVLKGRPLCALLFDDMHMSVRPPSVIEHEAVRKPSLEPWTLTACHF